MKVKHVLFLVLFILIAVCIGGGYYYYVKNSYIQRADLPQYVQEKLIKYNSYNLELKKDYDIDDRHIMIFTFKQNGNNMLGYAVFKLMPNGKYKYDRFSSSNESTGYQTFLTENEQSPGENKFYYVFYGIILDKQPNKFKVEVGGKEYIEEIERNTYFLKVYPIIKGSETSITPMDN